MWQWSPNWNRMPGRNVIIGSCPRQPADVRLIQAQTGAQAFLSLQHDQCHAQHGIDYPRLAREGAALGLEMVRSPMRDFNARDQQARLAGAVRTLNHLLSENLRVYIHCTAGLNRAPLVFMSELILMRSWRPDDALAFVRRYRPGAMPYMEAALGCREDLCRRGRERIARKAYAYFEQGSGNPVDNWYRAEREVILETLLGLRSAWHGGQDGLLPAYQSHSANLVEAALH